ncbi:MAG: (d)CMP kinase [Alphaproteobacteria bacterium]|nr:(d)CMP kinase [Alphaproteobacteria bacterium]
MNGSFTVAIDGPAAAGKGTIAKAVARYFDFEHLDTGLLYRAVGVKTRQSGDAVSIAQNLDISDLRRDDLRTAAAAEAASQVATNSDVRAALLAFQREFARRAGGAVLDGRDIGTVVCPQAEVKLFVTASPEIRAERRFAELCAQGAKTTFEAVLADVTARDARDQNRATAPMRPADDALLLDTTKLSIDAAVTMAVANIKKAMQGRD